MVARTPRCSSIGTCGAMSPQLYAIVLVTWLLAATACGRSSPVAPPVAQTGAGTPGTVADLAVDTATENGVTLSFTEVDDGTGQPAQYVVRYAVAPMGWGWGSATDVSEGTCSVPMAGTAIGAHRTCTVLDLAPSTTYDFRLVAYRGTLNQDAVFGDLSNVATGTTGAARPGTVTNLSVVVVWDRSVTLQFWEVDDGTGQPAQYVVRYAVAPMGWGWGSATDVSEGTCRVPMAGISVGRPRSCTVLGLDPSTTYDFRLVAYRGTLDQDAVFGDLSNIATGTTPPQSGYDIVDLGTLAGGASVAVDVNDQDQVAGNSDGHAFLWQAGVMTDLGTLGGEWSEATEINGTGQVVGRSANAAGEPRAFLWSGGGMVDLGSALRGSQFHLNDGPYWEIHLNSRGQVAWTAPLPDGTTRALLWTDGVVRDLGTLGDTGSSRAFGLNDIGQVVGRSNGRPFVWQDGVMRALPSFDRGASARDINNRGQVVGDYSPPGDDAPRRALFWDGDQVIDLGTLPEDRFSIADMINEAGQIVVHSYPVSWYPVRSFLLEGGVITRLEPFYRYYGARDINESGMIVAEHRPWNRYQRAVLWERGVNKMLPLLGAENNSAAAISSTGTIVGWAMTATGQRHAVLWRKAPAASPAVSAAPELGRSRPSPTLRSVYGRTNATP